MCIASHFLKRKIGQSTVYTCVHDFFFSQNTWTSEKLSVPDGFKALRAVALVMSDNLGLGFTPVPQQVIHTSVHAEFMPTAVWAKKASQQFSNPKKKSYYVQNNAEKSPHHVRKKVNNPKWVTG